MNHESTSVRHYSTALSAFLYRWQCWLSQLLHDFGSGWNLSTGKQFSTDFGDLSPVSTETWH